MTHKELKKIIFQSVIGTVIIVGSMGLATLVGPKVGAFCEKTYQKYESQIKSIESAYSGAAMLSFGMWDPNYEPYKPNQNSK